MDDNNSVTGDGRPVVSGTADNQDGNAMEGPLPQTREAVDWWLTHWGREELLSGVEAMSRQDVEDLIRVNGGTPAGLDLSIRNLHSADLSGIDLREANLQAADLGRTDLRDADLFRVDLREADLFRADLRGTFLMQANMDNAYLLAVRMNDQTNLEDINWGRKYVGGWERDKLYQNARAIYRQLNTWHQNHGYTDIAGEFLYREWVCKRLECLERLLDGLHWRNPIGSLLALDLQWWRNVAYFIWLGTHELLFGYGERPIRVAFTAASVVFSFALVYFLYPFSQVLEASPREFLGRAWDSFYFSLVSFTTLGYGGWISHPDSWIRNLGGIQSFIGLFLTALFLVTFNRKWNK